MKSLYFLPLITLFGIASAEVVKPGHGKFSDQFLVRPDEPVRVIQLPSKIITVNVPGKEVTRYVTVAEKKVVPAGEFAALKKQWDDEQESQTLALALKIADQLDTLTVSGDDQLTVLANQKKEAVIVAVKVAKENPCAITRRALVGAIERLISK